MIHQPTNSLIIISIKEIPPISTRSGFIFKILA
jgi:hypothetical protein